MTLPVAFIAFFVLPDYPKTTRWLSPEEKKLAMYRIAAQNVSAQTDATNVNMTIREAIKSALLDPSTYLIWFSILMLNSAASFGSYFPQIIASQLKECLVARCFADTIISFRLQPSNLPPAYCAAVSSRVGLQTRYIKLNPGPSVARWLHALRFSTPGTPTKLESGTIIP